MALGNLLKNIRAQAGYTLKTLSEKIGENKPSEMRPMHMALLNRYELGKYDLSEERMQKILMYGFNKTPQEPPGCKHI